MDKSTLEDNPVKRQDCTARISSDWAIFTDHLTDALSELEEDEFLILSAKHGNRYLQFACQGSWGMRVEVSSNHFLEGEDRLNRAQKAWLRAHGWRTPTGSPRQATPERDPDGSPNYFIDFPAAQSVTDIARLAIETLIHALALPYPAALAYESFDSAGAARECEAVGLALAARAAPPEDDEVLSVFRRVTGLEDLERDEDGDLVVRYGAIVICAVAIRDRVRLHAALVTKVAQTPALLRKLNQINDGPHPFRVFWRDEAVHAMLDVAADPFVPAHLVAAMREFSEVAEGLAIVLQAEYAGKALIDAAEPLPYLQ